MKTYNRLFESICSFENLMAAARTAERGRRLRCDVGQFRSRVERKMIADLYSNRSGKGTHAAIRRTIRCGGTLRLMDAIIDNSNSQEPVCTVFPGDDIAEAAQRRVGLPIGNPTLLLCPHVLPMSAEAGTGARALRRCGTTARAASRGTPPASRRAVTVEQANSPRPTPPDSRRAGNKPATD